MTFSIAAVNQLSLVSVHNYGPPLFGQERWKQTAKHYALVETGIDTLVKELFKEKPALEYYDWVRILSYWGNYHGYRRQANACHWQAM